jgi:hypothetical protein
MHRMCKLLLLNSLSDICDKIVNKCSKIKIILIFCEKYESILFQCRGCLVQKCTDVPKKPDKIWHMCEEWICGKVVDKL